MKKALFILGILALQGSFSPSSFPLAVNHPVGQPISLPRGPEGLTELIDTVDRVCGYAVNWNDWFFYSGDTEAFNKCLKKYAQIKLPRHCLVIHEGEGITSPISAGDSQRIHFDWQINVYKSPYCPALPFSYDGPTTGTVLFLELWIDEKTPNKNKAIRLSDVRIPSGIEVEAGKDSQSSKAIARFVEGHKPQRSAWYSIFTKPGANQTGVSSGKPVLGTVVAPRQIVAVTLWSESQKQTLDFSTAGARAVVGTYRLLNVSLKDTDSMGRTWEIRGNFPFDAPKVVIGEGETARIAADTPLRVEIKPRHTAQATTIDLELGITGPTGGVYGAPRMNGSSPTATFEILDPDGRGGNAGAFDYG